MANAIAQKALTQVGVPFRLHGRVPNVGLDCVGLVAHALALKNVPDDYSLRGNHAALADAYLKSCGCTLLSLHVAPVPGDIAVIMCAPRQLHLLVRVEQGWVHAHTGLRKVVLTPDPLPWPIAQIWRFEG